MNKTTHRTSGFTIVELLIVIVVIGILAAIAIIAYTGIKNRADAARASATVSNYVRLLQLYKTEKGTFPTTPSGNERCLGAPSDFPATGSFSAGSCYVWRHDNGYVWEGTGSQSLVDALAPYGSITSGLISSSLNRSDEWERSEEQRGIIYYRNPSTDTVQLSWYVNGAVSCAPGQGDPGSYWGVTWCEMTVK